MPNEDLDGVCVHSARTHLEIVLRCGRIHILCEKGWRVSPTPATLSPNDSAWSQALLRLHHRFLPPCAGRGLSTTARSVRSAGDRGLWRAGADSWRDLGRCYPPESPGRKGLVDHGIHLVDVRLTASEVVEVVDEATSRALFPNRSSW
jgi:hypothetical protein